ncbi:unnamed protein product [Notodromas monacha]|uniref:VWFA domain-containing protein n=1 Tax=Notodromas monacha TaxID=399045 RepID=A0A7R9C2K9_9CRUS|nr:unnamed protein product [Notodromas monacha]CAG0925027.1 unnamed protein product [Notodromas monacha]
MLAIDAQVTFGSGKNPDFPLGAEYSSPTEFTNNHEKDFTKYRNQPAESSPATGSDIKNGAANNLARIEHVSGSHVTIDYSPTLQDQKLLRETKPGVSGTFVVRYDVDHSPIGELYVVDGYFVHYLAPDATPYKPMPKHAVFVIDTSGSMFGFKMEQTKDAMKTIIKELTINEDYLSIVTFSSGARTQRYVNLSRCW